MSQLKRYKGVCYFSCYTCLYKWRSHYQVGDINAPLPLAGYWHRPPNVNYPEIIFYAEVQT